MLVGSEDCLFLNIFTSRKINSRITEPYWPIAETFKSIESSVGEKDVNKLNPVLVWIHGGSFNYGSASAWSERIFNFVEKVFEGFNKHLSTRMFIFSLKMTESVWIVRL